MMDDIKVILLVGGMGTRLRSVVPNAPKPLAKVGEKSFLDLVVRQLRNQGIRRLVMCTGYLADQIEEQFGDGREWDVEIEYSRELEPMGTAGALKLAQNCVRNAPLFVAMNGDSFLEVDFRELLQFHRKHGGVATLAALRVGNASRYGTVQLDSEGRVTGFVEKTGISAPGLISAGVYVFDASIWQHIPEGPASLEREVFPRLLDQGVYAKEQHGMFIDIGTPEDYALAQRLFSRLDEAAISPAGSRSQK